MFQGGFVSWFLFYSFLPLAIYSLLLFFLGFNSLDVKRRVEHTRITAGQSLKVEIECKRRIPFPLIYIIIKDQRKNSVEKAPVHNKAILYPLFSTNVTVVYELVNMPRGVFYWDEITLQIGDPFGLMKREKKITVHSEVVVYPKYKELQLWKTVNERNMGTDLTVHRHSEDVTSVMGIRDYAPGDRLSRIHWKASARTNSLKTKEYEHQVTNDFMFFLDREGLASATDTKGTVEGPNSLFERAVSLTASLAKFALAHRFSVGLVSYGRIATRLSLSREEEQLFRIFEHLARVEADAEISFAKLVMKEIVYLPIGTTAVIICPRLTKEIAMMLGDLTHRKIKVELFWVKENKELSDEEKQYIDLIEGLQVTYYLVIGDDFNDILKGGNRHVSA
jgi:uncharacterized protein (DUF58 family)